jgi:drug/metabolite transporter (DMT)-like permease
MPELSISNIAQISNDIRKQDIIFSHLAEELIDHICCDVEYEMNNGLSFHEAYLSVRARIGDRRVKEIQEETLYAVDTKYRQMKNTMKISCIAGTIILGFAALFKIMHLPGASIMTVLGALALSFVFMPSALVVLWKETHSRKRLFLFISAFFAGILFTMGVVFKTQHWPGAGWILFLAAITGILFFIPALLVFKLKDQENRSKKTIYILGTAGLILYVLGFFFKIQHWPLASTLMMAGLSLTFFLVFPWYAWVSWKEEENVSAKFIFMVIGSLAIMMPSMLINLNLSRNYDGEYYILQREQQALFEYRFNENRAYMLSCTDSIALPLLAGIDSKTGELLRVINEIEAKIIAYSEGEPGNPAAITDQIKQSESGPEIQFSLLRRPFHTTSYMDFLQEGSISRTELKLAVDEYSDFLSALIPGDETARYLKLIDPSVCLAVTVPKPEKVSLMSALHMTELLKTSLLTVESYAFSAVSKH